MLRSHLLTTPTKAAKLHLSPDLLDGSRMTFIPEQSHSCHNSQVCPRSAAIGPAQASTPQQQEGGPQGSASSFQELNSRFHLLPENPRPSFVPSTITCPWGSSHPILPLGALGSPLAAKPSSGRALQLSLPWESCLYLPDLGAGFALLRCPPSPAILWGVVACFPCSSYRRVSRSGNAL